MKRKKVVIAGSGTRALNFADALLHQCSAQSELAGLYDLNPRRMEGFCHLIDCQLPCFVDFDTMVREVKPDTLVVCVTDRAHPELVELAFAYGLDVVLEKPMAMDIAGIERILAAERRYGRKVIVTFNMRFSPYSARIKEILLSNPVGKIHSVSAEWFIDRTHGNEYFHRWHGKMSNGGGLLVHKATHNFDLLNWFLDDLPEEVFAWGALREFGSAGKIRGERCRNCEHHTSCPAVLNMEFADADLNPKGEANIFKKLYFEAEQCDGYRRDQCCFDPSIDIYDTMNALIRYRSGIQVSYALNAYSAWQGYKISFTGEHGVMTVETVNSSTRPQGYELPDSIRIVNGTTRQNITMRELSMEQNHSPHGGGDAAMFEQLFGKSKPDSLGQTAGSSAGSASALVGICANESIVRNCPIKLPEL